MAVRVPWNYDKAREAEKQVVRHRWYTARLQAPRRPICSPPLTRVVRSRYMDYDTIYPRSSTPIAFPLDSLPLCETRDSLTDRSGVSVSVRKKGTARVVTQQSSSKSSRSCPRHSPERASDYEELPAIEGIHPRDDARTMAMPSESLIRVPFQDALPDKESVVFYVPQTPPWTGNDCKKPVEPSPSEPFVPILPMGPSFESFTECAGVGVARQSSPEPPPYCRLFLKADSDSSSPWAQHFNRNSSAPSATTHEGACEGKEKSCQTQIDDLHNSPDAALDDAFSVQDDLPPLLPATVSKSKTLRDISTILQVAGEVYKSDQHLSKDSILQLGVLYKEADAVLRSTAIDDASALLHDAEEQHRTNQRLIKDVLEEQQAACGRAGEVVSKSKFPEDEPSVQKENQTMTIFSRPTESGVAGQLGVAERKRDVPRPIAKTPLDVSAILHAADVIGELCSSDIGSTGEKMALPRKPVDNASMSIEQGDSRKVKDTFSRIGKKPTASGEGRSQDTTEDQLCHAAHHTSGRQHRRRCKHKGDHNSSSSTKDTVAETPPQGGSPSPLGVLERLRRRVLKSPHPDRQSVDTEGVVTMDPSVEILSFPARSAAAHYHRNSLRQESSVVLVDFISPISPRSPHHTPSSKPRGSLTHVSPSSPPVSSVSTSTSLSDDVAESSDKGAPTRKVVSETVHGDDGANQNAELTKIV